jgi:hypothetical protein
MNAAGWIGIGFVFGVVGMAIGSNNKVGAGAGFFFGALLGPIGWLIAASGAKRTTLDRIESRPSEPGWFQDPLGRFDARWFDGTRWTGHVTRGQSVLEDPV